MKKQYKIPIGSYTTNPTPHSDDAYYYLKNLTKHIDELKILDDKIYFRNVDIKAKAKYYNALNQIIFYIERINMLLDDHIIINEQDDNFTIKKG